MRRTTADRAAASRSLAVFTDLDGCLLDARDYGFAPARTVLRRLRERGVPLVICTSKTRAEVRDLFAQLGSRHLAIIEDGGGLLVPPGIATRIDLPSARRTRDGRLVELSAPYARVRSVFGLLRRRTRGAVVGFGDLSVADVARVSGLAPHAARRARRREFDEPFLFLTGKRRYAAPLMRIVAAHGLRITRGGRFYHLHGHADKGKAMRLARAVLERQLGPLFVVALGDSPLDAPLLLEADLPIIVPRPDGRPDAALCRLVPKARVASLPGPAGWARAVAGPLRGAPVLPGGA